MDWSPELALAYDLTPWGNPPTLPDLTPRPAQFGEPLHLLGYRIEKPVDGKLQLWMGWETLTTTSRDWSVSLRLYTPDGTLLLQKDGRLASLWYPDSTLPANKTILTVFDIDLPPDLPSGTVARVVVYDPVTVAPLLTPDGQDVVELGIINP